MSYISLSDVCIDFPVFDAGQRSLKKHIVQVATGGFFNTTPKGEIVVRALDTVSFVINEGDRVGVIGHNGAGKSTLLRLLSRIYMPSSGSVDIKGDVSSLIDISLGIDPDLSGRDNIYIRGQLLGISKAQIKRNIDNIIEFSELGSFVDIPLRTYSTGMHLRLAFAVSTIITPEILLMDEWLAVGDASFTKKSQSRLEQLVNSSNILVIASHTKDVIMNLCNRVIWLEHGKIHRDGPPATVCQEYFV